MRRLYLSTKVNWHLSIFWNPMLNYVRECDVMVEHGSNESRSGVGNGVENVWMEIDLK